MDAEEKRNPPQDVPAAPSPDADWAALPGERPPAPFPRTGWDRGFALLFYVLGYGYADKLLGCSQRWYITAFTVCYAAAVLAYFLCKGIRPRPASWFWLAVLLSVGASFSLYENAGLLDFDLLVLHGTAMYWPLCASGSTLRDGTSPLLPADLLNSFLLVPFGNFFSQFRCLFGGWKLRRTGAEKRLGAILLGVGILAVLLLLVVPLLMRADQQFSDLLSVVRGWFRFDWNVDLFPLILALPTGMYLFGLSYGCANRRHTAHIRTERLAELGRRCRVIPTITIRIALAGVCAVYILFIAVQAQHLFSAFAGRLTGTDVYSEFAREGFFELCRVAAINGCILLGADLLASTERMQNRTLRIYNVVMSALTLLILASAARKMLLYIQAYGLTPKRVLTMAFMAMLAVLFGGIAVSQFRRFPLIRLAVCFSAVLFCALALCNLDALIAAFNAAHGLAAAA